jgi:hypothetical protein
MNLVVFEESAFKTSVYGDFYASGYLTYHNLK